MALKATAVIPARNEAQRIGPILQQAHQYVEEIIVVDDNSTDCTVSIAYDFGRVVQNTSHQGYVSCLKKGFKEAEHDIIITLDGDGEHDPSYIPELIKPIEKDQADVVLGVRKNITRPSEKIINYLTNFRVKTADCGTGFRAIRKTLAQKLQLEGACTCGILVLEAHAYGARIADVEVINKRIVKPRRIAWEHLKQLFIVIKWLLT
jgi:glycosyltransferase involved in cell wall biosynthesis